MGPLLVFLLTWYQLQAITQSALIGYTAGGAAGNGLNDNAAAAAAAINSINGNNMNLNSIDADGEMDDIDLDALLMLPPELVDDDTDISNNTPHPPTSGNSVETELPLVRTNYDETEVEFRHHPITSVNIDYAHNSVVLKFRKDTPQQQQLRARQLQLLRDAEEQRRTLEKNFMRFGRASSSLSSAAAATPSAAMDFMRFGKRQVEQLPRTDDALGDEGGDFGARTGRGYHSGGGGGGGGGGGSGGSSGIRDSRGDNFMRFGRASSDFMRFGRSRDPGRDYMRLGRATPSQDFMRFGRSRSDNFMRLGRSGSQAMRALQNNNGAGGNGRGADTNFIRFGRRFGPPERDQTENFMRLGKLDQNFMRFGKSYNYYNKHNNNNNVNNENRTKETEQQKQELRATAKLLHQSQKDGDENPMDKAIQVLFSKQQQQQQKHKPNASHSSLTTSAASLAAGGGGGGAAVSSSSEEAADNGKTELDISEYVFN